MAADEYNDSDRFSDDDVYDNLGENDFDLFELTEEERAELANAFKDDSESGDELDDENLPLFFTQPVTFWVDRWGTLLWHETYLWCPMQMCTET